MKRRQNNTNGAGGQPRKPRPPKRPEPRGIRSATTIGAPAGAAAVVASQHLGASNATSVLHHGPTGGAATEVANTLGHHATEGAAVAAGAVGAAVAGTSAGGSAGGAAAVGAGVAGGAVAAGAGAGAGAGGGAAGGAAASQGPAVAIGGAAAATVAAVVIVVTVTGDEPEVAEPAPTPTTTIAPAPVAEPPTPGPGQFEATTVGSLDGDLLAGVNQDTEAGQLLIVGLLGEPTNVGVAVPLESGATITVEPTGAFSYVPAESFSELGVGESVVETLTYVVTNLDGFTAEWTATITVNGENEAPTIEAVEPVSLSEGQTETRDLVWVDPNDDRPTFSLAEGSPAFVTIDDDGTATPQVVVSAGDGTAGEYEVTIVVADGAATETTTSTSFTISVAAAAVDPVRVEQGLAALYLFNEGDGALVADSAGAGGPGLTVADPDAVTWVDGAISIDRPTIIASDGAATGLIDAVKASGAFTVEAWVTPANAEQNGPARIVSISNGIGERNTTLGQGGTGGDAGGDLWTSRQRSTGTSTNGTPDLATPAGSVVADRLTHLVVTRSADGQVLFHVDGSLVATGTADGDLSNWDGALPLVLANETSLDRPWLGRLHLVALYSRALTEAEIAQNFSVGPR